MVKGIKRPVLLFIKAVISLTVLGFLIHVAQIKLELFVNFFSDPVLFLSVIFLFLLMVMIAAWRWYILNSAQEIRVSFLNILKASYFGAAFNNVLPGAVGGDIVRLYFVFNKEPLKKSKILLSVFFDRIMGFLAVFATIFLVGLMRITSFLEKPELFYLLSLCMAFCFSTIIICGTLILFSKQWHIGAWLDKYFSNQFWAKPFILFFDAVHHYRMTGGTFVKSLFISLMLQSVIVGTILLIAKIVGLPAIGFSDYMVAIGITQIVNLIPITPGGIGLGEMAFANILSILNPGVSGAYATIFFAYRIISILAYLPGLIWCLFKFTLFKKENQLREGMAMLHQSDS